MATTDGSGGGMRERCEHCGLETVHDVSVQIRTESCRQENAQFSREPYRVTECRKCGFRRSKRMNNA